MEERISIRLKNFIDSLGITDSMFADNCGMSRSTLSLLLSGKNKKVSDQQIAQIHRAYPELSIVWLMFGEGSMLNGDSRAIETENGDENVRNSAFSENDFIENPTIGPSQFKEENLRGLNQPDSGIKNLNHIKLELEQKIQNLEAEISKMKSTPRKVTKITIFYDDSTFETFKPE